MNRLSVIEGEADETDEEEGADSKEDEKKVQPRRARVHIDEKLFNQWRNLASDTYTVTWRRSQPALRNIREIEKVGDQTFKTIQSTSVHLRSIANNLTQVDHHLSGILEAAQLLPETFPDQVSIDKNIKI